jgi:hypothetical protein
LTKAEKTNSEESEEQEELQQVRSNQTHPCNSRLSFQWVELKTRASFVSSHQFNCRLRYRNTAIASALLIHDSLSIMLSPHLCPQSVAWENWFTQPKLHVLEPRRIPTRKGVYNVLDANPDCASTSQYRLWETASLRYRRIDVKWVEIA